MMKLFGKRTLAALVALLLPGLLLAGCGGNDDGSSEGGTQTGEDNASGLEVSFEGSYASEKIEAGELCDITEAFPIGEDLMYIGLWDFDFNEREVLYVPSSGEVKESHFDYPGTLEEGEEVSTRRCAPNAQGGVTTTFSLYTDYTEGEGDANFGSYETVVVDFDAEGNVLGEHSLGSEMLNAIYPLPDGRYLADVYGSDGTDLLLYDEELKNSSPINDDDMYYMYSLSVGDSGDIYVTYQASGDSRNLFGTIDLENQKLNKVEISGVPDWISCAFGGNGDPYEVYVSDEHDLYGVDFDKGTCEPVVNWINSDFSGSNVTSCALLPSGEFLVCQQPVSEQPDKPATLWRLFPRDEDELSNVTLISLSCISLNSQLGEAINQFNRTNGEYRIAVANYDKYNTDENPEGGAEKLKTDMISGIVADITCTEDLDFYSLDNKGLFMDLTGKVDGMDGCFSSAFDVLKTGDKLDRLAFFFNVDTFCAKETYAQSMQGKTPSEYLKGLQGLPEGMLPLEGWMTRDYMLTLMQPAANAFIDRDTQECHFDSPEFISLLEICNTALDEKGVAAYEGGTSSSEEFLNDKSLMRQNYIKGLWNSWTDNYLHFHDEPVSWIGYPVLEGHGNGGAFDFPSCLSISAGTEHPDACLSFFSYLLSDECQSSIMTGFPVNVNAFEEACRAEVEKERPEEDRMYAAGNEDPVLVSEMPQSYADDLESYVEGIGLVEEENLALQDILTEEAGKYFVGDTTAEEAASMIQSRVSLYLSEQS